MSLRTLMLIVTAMCVLFAAFQSGSATFTHLAMVLSFGVPGASAGFDRSGTQRVAIICGCFAAILGTALVSGVVLIWDFAKIWV